MKWLVGFVMVLVAIQIIIDHKPFFIAIGLLAVAVIVGLYLFRKMQDDAKKAKRQQRIDDEQRKQLALQHESLTLEQEFIAEMRRAAQEIRPLPKAGVLQAPLALAHPHAGSLLMRLVQPLYNPRYAEFADEPLMTYHANLYEIAEKDGGGEFIHPPDYKKPDLFKRYLKGTGLEDFFDGLTYPLEIPELTRFEHEFILAPPGSGKTTLIEAHLAEDFKKVALDGCSVIVMDSENVFIPRLARSRIFARGGPLHGKLVYLEPEAAHPLALNIFDVKKETGDAEQRAIARREVQETVLASVSGTNDTQDAMLRYLVRLCLEIPNPTIDTLIEVLTPEGFKKNSQYLDKLDAHSRRYFETTFKQDTRRATKEAVQSRLNDAMSEETFQNMFLSPRNRFNMLEQIEKGRVILINTKRLLLGTAGCGMFGRFFLANLVHASLHRNETSKPVYCYVDECQDYFATDEGIADFLVKARKRNIGMILATQDMSTIKSPKVRDSLMNVAVRLIGNEKQRGRFQCSIRWKTENPVEVQVQQAPDLGRMSEFEFSAIRQDMRRDYCVPLGLTHEDISEPNADAPSQPDVTLKTPDLPWKLDEKPLNDPSPVVHTRQSLSPEELADQQASTTRRPWIALEKLARELGAETEDGKSLDLSKLSHILDGPEIGRFDRMRDERNKVIHRDAVPLPNPDRWFRSQKELYEKLDAYRKGNADDLDLSPSPRL